MILTTRNDLAGHRIVEEFGLVRGSTIRARHLGRDILASLKNLSLGGEIHEYTPISLAVRDGAHEGDMIEGEFTQGAFTTKFPSRGPMPESPRPRSRSRTVSKRSRSRTGTSTWRAR